MITKTYTTDSLALCPYLAMNGLKYIKAELTLGKHDKPTVSFLFEDPKGMGKDLELEFFKSEHKEYREYFFYFRNEIEKMKRTVDKAQVLEEKEKREAVYTGEDKNIKEG